MQRVEEMGFMLVGARAWQHPDRLPPSSSAISVSAILLLLAATIGDAEAFTWPWEVGGPWPTSSHSAVAPLGHPPLEQRLAERPPIGGFTFAVYGDQRALADGEWQALVADLARRAEGPEPPLFLIDTGDIVNDGRHSDQFAFLSELLAPLRQLPYLVAVGNHEVRNERDPRAREHLATFLRGVDPSLAPDRLYYEKRVGAFSFFFLDTNPWAYGNIEAADGQIDWLDAALARPPVPGERRIVVLHHPLVQSSRKHEEQAQRLWSARWGGRTLAERFAEGGVSLVLTGHTHTFEHFRIRRSDGDGFDLVNLSGRPRESILWIGDGARRARDIGGRERETLEERGWSDLEGWTIEQVDAMTEDEANQYALFRAGADGELSYQVVFLDSDAPDGVRMEPGAPLP